MPSARARTAVARPIGPGPTTRSREPARRSRVVPSQTPFASAGRAGRGSAPRTRASRRSPTRRSRPSKTPRAFVTSTSLATSSGNISASTPSDADWIQRRRSAPGQASRSHVALRTPEEQPRRPRRAPPGAPRRRARSGARRRHPRPRSRAAGPRGRPRARPRAAGRSQGPASPVPAVLLVVVADVALPQPPAEEHRAPVAARAGSRRGPSRDRAGGSRARPATGPPPRAPAGRGTSRCPRPRRRRPRPPR